MRISTPEKMFLSLDDDRKNEWTLRVDDHLDLRVNLEAIALEITVGEIDDGMGFGG